MIHLHASIDAYVRIHVGTYKFIHTHTHAWIQSHLYTYIHTYIHTHCSAALKGPSRRRPKSPPNKHADNFENNENEPANGNHNIDTNIPQISARVRAEDMMLVAKKGTNLRKREFRHLLSEADANHFDDVFESGCVQETPLKHASKVAELIAPKVGML